MTAGDGRANFLLILGLIAVAVLDLKFKRPKVKLLLFKTLAVMKRISEAERGSSRLLDRFQA